MMISQVFQSAVQGVHRFLAFAVLTIAASLVLNLGSVLFAIAKVPYQQILILNLAIFALGGVGFFLFARKAIPELTTGKLVRVSFNRVGRFAASIFVYQSITSIFYLFERSFIFRRFGADALTYYTVPFMFGLYLHGLILSFAQAAIPKLNEKIGRPEELRNIYESFTKIAVALALFLSLMFFFLGDTFLTLWLGAEFSANAYRLMVLHGAAFATIAVSIGCWILAEASHRPFMNAFSSVATVVVGIVSMIVLSQNYGLDGIAAGRVVGAAVVFPLIFILERKVFGSVLGRFWLVAVGSLAVSTATISGMFYLVFGGMDNSWPMFILAGTVLTGAFWTPLLISGYLNFGELRSSFANRFGTVEI
jgi:O-antigen/teichoic acid export membrane protein